MKRIVLAVMWILWTPVQAQDARSGYAYLGAETRALQDDDFANPGMFWVEYGLAIYQSREGADESSCASCHGEPESLRGASTHYPPDRWGDGGHHQSGGAHQPLSYRADAARRRSLRI